jgi:ribulose-phosphate 3-epimerase
MDGHYVPNFTLGLDFCRALAGYTDIPLDIHLMIENVDQYIPDFAQIKQAVICFHPEVSYHPLRSIQLIKSCGAKAGIALDPAMPLEQVRHLTSEVDLICVMTVNPGYAGQKLVPGTIDKIREVADHVQQYKLGAAIEVDGNVSWENIPKMLEAGAEVLVGGSSSLFARGTDLKKNIIRLQSVLKDFTGTH